MKFPNSHAFRLIGDPFVTNLTFGASLASTPSVLSISTSPFSLQVPPIIACVDNRLTNDFVHHQLAPFIGNRVTSHITASKTKSCMIQMQSMATINLETRNPPNALERQVQTLAFTIEQLT